MSNAGNTEAPEEKTERLRRMALRWFGRRIDEIKKMPHHGEVGFTATIRNGDIVEIEYLDKTTVR